ncbi:SPOR domain-containing protein [Pseudokineococcus sp. 1T1Z-3]|uniref:SPOR domain-containing protein n=1 Tax=Pseudokineococcus sp. 1T1Z-3 TaxID=3132745 RepID=UPI0030A8272B
MADIERTAWFYNVVTGEVEHGPQSLGRRLMGPYDTEAEARKALETARARTEAWDEEDERRRREEEEWGQG